MTKSKPKTLTFFRGKDVLGTIDVDAAMCDFPWFGGRFTPAPAFAEVAPLFSEELALMEQKDFDDWDTWEDIWAEIEEPGLRLVGAGGEVVSREPLIHIRDGEAWWRD